MKKILSGWFILAFFISQLTAFSQTDGDIWLHMLTTGTPASTVYLGDKLNNSGGTWYINFEVGQESWYQSDVGIGKSNTDPTGSTWRTATWYENGTGANKRVRADFGDFQFTSTGTWYFAGRAKADAGDPFHYANNDQWSNSSLYSPVYFFTVNALNNPSSQTATQDLINKSSQINLTWLKNAQAHNVMIVRKKSTESWTEPTQGTAYPVGSNIGNGVVVYNNGGTSYSNTGLNSSTTYDYRFYSENYSYYSSGVEASASTASAATNYYRTRESGIWGAASTWESSYDNSFWINATIYPNGNASGITVQSAHTITSLGTSRTVNSSLVVNGTLLCASNVIEGSGSFTLAPGATLGIGSLGGIAASPDAIGNIRVTGTRSYSNAANYTYTNGSNMVTGSGFPQTGFSGTLTVSCTQLKLSNSLQLTGTGKVVVLSSGKQLWFDPGIVLSGSDMSTGGGFFTNDNSWLRTYNTNGFDGSITLGADYLSIHPGTLFIFNANTTTPFMSGLSEPVHCSVSNWATITLNKDLYIEGKLDLAGGLISAGGKSISYGASSNLNFYNTAYSTTDDLILPAINGPANISISNHTTGLTLHASRTLTGNLVISSGSKFIIPAGINLTVEGLMMNMNNYTGIIIKSSAAGTGSLIHSTAGIPGTVERYIPAATWGTWDDGWHFLSAPVADQVISPEFVASWTLGSEDFYKWDEPANTWINIKNSNGTGWTPGFETNFVPGRGYLVAYQNDVTKSFTGSINVFDVPVSGLTLSNGANSGWHLLGNPYTAALTWYNGWSAENIGGVANIWNESGRSYSPVNQGEIIPSANGFMVQVTSGTGSLNIPVANRVHSSQAWYKESGYPVIKLFAHNLDNNSFQESQVRLNPASTNGFDTEFDGHFLPGYAPLFYSVSGDHDLMVNSIPEPGFGLAIPFRFIKNEGNSFSIEATGLETLENGTPVYLKDKKLGIDHKLTENPVYPFTAADGDDPDRFELKFGSVGIGKPVEDPGINAWFSGYVLYISDLDGDAVVDIFNMSGQQINSRQISGSGVHSLRVDLTAGVYFARITNNGRLHTVKMIVQ